MVFEKKSVVVITTNEKVEVGDLVKCKWNEIHILSNHDGNEYTKSVKKVAIAIISDEIIKVGDYAVGVDKMIYQLKEGEFTLKADRKIIAITHIPSHIKTTPLPIPPKTFITSFITEYNNSECDPNILVRYEPKPIFGNNGSCCPIEYQPKVNSKHNTVTIIKDKNIGYVENILELRNQMSEIDSGRGCAENMRSEGFNSARSICVGMIDKWIEKHVDVYGR